MLNKLINKIKTIRFLNQAKKTQCIISKKAFVDSSSRLEGNNKVQGDSCVYKCYLGKGTYMGSGCIFRKTKIGRFCSLGSDIKILDGNHPTSMLVSTYPAFFRSEPFCNLYYGASNAFEEHSYVDDTHNWICEIGNDVWIADSVLILGGIRIGDGAVIAAGAVVTDNVPPYAIVGGIPAKILKYRFDEKSINWLEKFKWWEKDDQWLTENIKKFENIDMMIE